MTDTEKSTALNYERLHPLNLVPPQYRDRLLSALEQVDYPAGTVIIRQRDIDFSHSYLLNGAAELRISFDNRTQLNHHDTRSLSPLEDLIQSGGSIRAIDDCQLLRISRDILDELLAEDSSSEGGMDLKLVDIHSDYSEGEQLIDDDSTPDWTSIFLQSALANQLPPSELHQLFSKLEGGDYDEGEIIIREHSDPDFFYIIEQGYAVISSQSGPFADKQIEIGPGEYFGDEALVANTIRNASVTMSSRGRLLRLGSADFDSLIKSHLVKTDNMLDEENWQLIDVRMPVEYRHGHSEGSINLPISKIRTELTNFDHSTCYRVTTEGGRRSELATYLMRQAGLDVMLTPQHQHT